MDGIIEKSLPQRHVSDERSVPLTPSLQISPFNLALASLRLVKLVAVDSKKTHRSPTFIRLMPTLEEVPERRRASVISTSRRRPWRWKCPRPSDSTPEIRQVLRRRPCSCPFSVTDDKTLTTHPQHVFALLNFTSYFVNGNIPT